ncbi:MAG: hypothetical protein JWN66_1128 [Sphingomonas bacterium]|jgi:protein TonB|nr:hypothetical protein [Sphingomonas bacterium]
MYADRHARRMKLDPGSLGLSAAMVATMMAGLIYSVPEFAKKVDPGIRIIDIIEPAPPPPEPPKPLPKAQDLPKTTPVYKPDNVIPIVKTETPPVVSFDPGPRVDTRIPEGTGGGGNVLTIKPPVIVGPGTKTNFNYQPEYPSDERRLGREGRVVVKVLVGTDGRVKQVEKVSAASDSFFEATRRRALEKWRLTPGTRDGVPIEAWRTMAVSFVMTEE